MPVYDHYCTVCDTITEIVCKIADRKAFIVCPDCGGMAERIVSSQILRNEPTWLGSAVDNLHDEAKAEVRDRSDYNRYLKQHGIVERG